MQTSTQPLQERAFRPLNTNDVVFLDLEVGGKYYGRLTFELFPDTPLTSANFKALCTGELGNSPSTGVPLTYKGSKFTRLYQDYLIQGGDYTRGDGKGGESIYPGNYFEDENYLHSHSGAGTLAMANVPSQPGSNTS